MTGKNVIIIKKLLARKKGQGFVEYIFIVSLVAIGLILALASLGSYLRNFFNLLADLLVHYTMT